MNETTTLKRDDLVDVLGEDRGPFKYVETSTGPTGAQWVTALEAEDGIFFRFRAFRPDRVVPVGVTPTEDDAPKTAAVAKGSCTEDGCEDDAARRGLCARHYRAALAAQKES